MNFTINRDVLSQNLSYVSKALSNKIQMPGLTGILFNVSKKEIILTASNNEISIQTTIKKDFTVVEGGNFLVQGKFLIEIIKKLNATDVDFISFDENTIKILAGKSVFTLNCLSIDSFPMISFDNSDVKFTIDTPNLRQIIRKTVFAISNNESRVVLTGVSLKAKDNVIEVTATDSFRLARKKLEFDYNFPEINIVIPGKSFEELNKILEGNFDIVEIHCSSSKILFKIDNILFQSRLIEGVFPKIDSLIPTKYVNKLQFSKEDLTSIIDRVSIFVNLEQSNIIKLSINTNGTVEFTSISNELGAAREEATPISSDINETMQIAFSSKYLSEALRTFDDDKVEVKFTGEIKPFVITSEKDKNLIQLILPVRA